jgi:hypothetical protein
VHTCNPGTREVEQEDLELQVSLGYIGTPCFKKRKQTSEYKREGEREAVLFLCSRSLTTSMFLWKTSTFGDIGAATHGSPGLLDPSLLNGSHQDCRHGTQALDLLCYLLSPCRSSAPSKTSRPGSVLSHKPSGHPVFALPGSPRLTTISSLRHRCARVPPGSLPPCLTAGDHPGTMVQVSMGQQPHAGCWG